MKTIRSRPAGGKVNLLTAGVVSLLGLTTFMGCDSFGPEEPGGPGAIFVDLQSPNGAEGAAVFEIEGGVGLGTVATLSGWVYFDQTEERTRVVAILPTPGPIQFQMRVEDVARPPNVTLVEVADPNNDLRPSLEGYSVDIFQVQDRRAR